MLSCKKILPSTTIQLYLFKSQAYPGNNEQLAGAAHAICQVFAFHNKKVNVIECYDDNPKIKIKKNSIALFSGVDGINKWEKLKSSYPRTFNVFLTHQWWDELLQILRKKEEGLNLIAAPQYTVLPSIQKLLKGSHTFFLGTNGVCTSAQPNDIIQAYLSSNLPKKQAPLAALLLPGDTQLPNGSWKLFTPEDAKLLATHISSFVQNKRLFLLITNGARTGKIDPKTGEETNAHKNGQVDFVSEAFLTELAKKLSADRFIFYNLQYNTPSMLNAMMGAVLLHEGSLFFVPGESISTASQAISLLDSHAVVLYKHNAMLDVHTEYLEEELKLGCASIMSSEGVFIRPNGAHVSCRTSPSQAVASKVYEMYNAN